MGLIKVMNSAIKSTFRDQWKEAIRCDDMTNEILMCKKTTSTGVISNGSIIIVAPGQCAILYDNGKVIDATAEEGVYTFDTSSTPSFFAGQFKDTFKEIWERFTYDGLSSKQQAVFFFNIKEIIENRFGTASPIPFQDWSHPLVNDISNTVMPIRLEIKCFGTYTFKISNPAIFMSEVAGVSDIYRKSDLIEQMKSEIIGLLQNIINELGNSDHKVPVLELPSQTDEIKEIIDERECDKAIRKRGILLESFVIESVTLTDESKEKIDNYEYSSSSHLQKTRMVDAYANAIEMAAGNSRGVLNGMMGIGIMNMNTNDMIKETATSVFNSNKEDNKKEQAMVWECPNCKKEVKGEFCSSCGTKKPEKKFCIECGNELDVNAKFCSKCGKEI